jgi:hypothetical protein
VLLKIKKVSRILSNMGWRYVIFRSGFEFKKRTGLLKKKFPLDPEFKSFYTLSNWRNNAQPFFFNSKEELQFKLPLSKQLTTDYKKISEFEYIFFSSLEFKLGDDFDWVTNPETGFKYNDKSHWIDINDYSEEAGDVKFVWEPSRFSNIYTFIRYEQYSGIDCSKQVFAEIENWIGKNGINRGPNFKCSQEISLRILNWTFALYYYRNSVNLTDDLFAKIQHYIYWQTHHVYNNINFSRIAVRNNHAITETLLLYISGTLFPEFPGAAKWKTDGKRWFEEEIAYQIYDDGTFLQFSMNYHRVVIQLLTWAIRLADLNGDNFSEVVYERAKRSLLFLTSCMDKDSGWLPNYGANDGALFFKLNDNHYRDYRPQLEALSYALGLKWQHRSFEDANWYGLNQRNASEEISITNGYTAFNKGGYYVFRQENSLSFIRCGNHHDRPSQADNLHLDIWYKGINILHDAGSYKYNTNEDTLKYFMGTCSHNTVMLDNYDQMEKGPRFIWYQWSQCENVKTEESGDTFTFEGTIKAFQHINKNITHTRKVIIYKNKPVWEVEDIINGKPEGIMLNQLWHTCYPELLNIDALADGNKIVPDVHHGYHSVFYGKKEVCTELVLSVSGNSIKNIISIKE